MGKTLTIFDLDNTLIKGDSSTLWSRFMVREGWVNDPDYLARETRLMDSGAADWRRKAGGGRAAGALRARRDYAARVSPGVGSDSDFTG